MKIKVTETLTHTYELDSREISRLTGIPEDELASRRSEVQTRLRDQMQPYLGSGYILDVELGLGE